MRLDFRSLPLAIRRRKLHEILTVTLLLTISVAASQSGQPDYNFGPPYFNNTFPDSPINFGVIQSFDRIERATFNIEHAGDFLAGDVRFFHPNLVTSGREASLSASGSGIAPTKLLWRGRPFRTLRNDRADLRLIPITLIGGAGSTDVGALSGFASTGGIVEFAPHKLRYDAPSTWIYTRNGFYEFAPVEFLHARRVGSVSWANVFGAFPSSEGRFDHARDSGNTLGGEFIRQMGAKAELSTAYMTTRRRTQIPIFDADSARAGSEQLLQRGDLDISYKRVVDKSTSMELAGYRVESRDRIGLFRFYEREMGAAIKGSIGNLGVHARIASLKVLLPGSRMLRETEATGMLAYRVEFNGYWTSIAGGVDSRLPDRIHPTYYFELGSKILQLGALSMAVQQAAQLPSLEIEHASYLTGKPIDDLNQLWRVHPDLPAVGANLPEMVVRTGAVSFSGTKTGCELNVTGYIRQRFKYSFWDVAGDTLIQPTAGDRWTTIGWNGSVRATRGDFRGMVAMTGFNTYIRGDYPAAVVAPEPAFRMRWEFGWHRRFFNGDFEADASMGGKYYDKFYADGPEGRQLIGGAYPLDFRLTARIKRFTLFWGQRNWNSYQYYLVPGYKMMHREEYWGIDWLLIN